MASEERILVSVRLRPVNAREAERGDGSDWECAGPTTLMFHGNIPERAMFPASYTYDRVFNPECSTRQVYEEGAKQVALSVLSGINSSIFAYGQTSSGKTYTMVGITERSMADIYDYIDKHPEREFVLKFSAMEIYNEAVRDLLRPDATQLRLLDDPEKGTVVEKLTEETLRDKGHLLELLAVCEAQRQIGETAMNETSSRSHQILRLTIESSAKQFMGRGKSSTLLACVNFVDLAGSERASQTQSAGVRLKEGSHINRSLLTLGKVIRQLSKGRNGHIPYRDSKLTRILQSSLGGNARTAIICTMSPAHSHIEQSRNTLLFANCAKNVVTDAKVNVVMSDKVLLKHLQREIARLENELKFPRPTSCSNYAEALREKDELIKQLEGQLKELMEQKDTVQSQLDNFRRVTSDGNFNDHATRQWDQSNRSSESLPCSASEDTLSFDTYSDVYEEQDDLGSKGFDVSHVYNDYHHDVYHQKVDEHPMSSLHQPRNHISNRTQMYQPNRETSPEVPKEHCKEVQCIKINEFRRSRSDEEKHGENITYTSEGAIKLYTCDSEPSSDTEKTNNDESLVLKRCVISSRDSVLTRSRSCRASFMVIPNSWFDDSADMRMTPPGDILKYPHRRLEKVRRSMYSENGHCQNDLTLDCPVVSGKVASDMVIDKNTCNEEDGYANNKFSCITKVKEKQEDYCTSQLEGNQQDNVTAEILDMKHAKNIDKDIFVANIDSPSRWPINFEKKQKEIIELWHECNVSIVHRTYFFLLFKGVKADNIYLEVEHRRLSFIHSSFIAGCEPNVTVTSSLRNLRHERDMLYKQMLRRLHLLERESLYSKWGIDLNSKQRRLQLSRRIWTQTDMEHVRESAALVIKLVEHLEKGQAIKEMFGLSFTLNQRAIRRPFSWVSANS
ncbi:kinesin-like protein KIN-7J isoform X1 [Zea mays]|uniref:Kinesin-like protein KIN-7G n=1 Tax=Zea mays TaxID=4577 RepID=A0A1D6I9J4_MAIZE|nr:kinesin-like protein KIN-7J [Zea mays]XP_020396629.1 kinesin-like protein KIN-7J [Zea mays]XP_035816948.1 kinesin-like protein KIN-7J [Zea mays]ONM56693.1 Kinesin-like protein KIN-7G [Zea mays]|eukprot:XP_008652981.2 kinesin-like protein KIN-7J isoform X1 [Zea mays]